MGIFSNLFRRLTGRDRPARVVQRKIEDVKNPYAAIVQQRIEEEKKRNYQYFDWTPVSSSWIEALRYNPTIPYAQMRVRMHARSKKNPSGVYTFGGMHLELFLSWINAGSKGRFFNSYLIGRWSESIIDRSVGRGIRAETARREIEETVRRAAAARAAEGGQRYVMGLPVGEQ